MYKYFRFTENIAIRSEGGKNPDFDAFQAFTPIKEETRSQWLKRVDKLLCDKWLEHFRDKNIPACVVATLEPKTNKPLHYNVWRMGEEAVGSQADKRNSEKLTGTIVAECCGFMEKTGLSKMGSV